MFARIVALTAELRSDSAVVATDAPRLSWIVEPDAPGWIQAWAELRRGEEVARIAGRDSVLVQWPFAPLRVGETASVQVRAASSAGTITGWSSPLEVRAGFVDDWLARPVALPSPETDAQPALFRRSFRIDRPVRSATLYGTALGVVDFTVNGIPAGDAVLTPGWTSYRERLVHDAVDVTAALREGENVLGAQLGGGWYTESYSIVGPRSRFFGDQPRLLAQVRIVYGDGSVETIATGDGWTASPGSVRESGIYAGEKQDARMLPAGWDRPGFDDASWAAAVVVDEPVPVPEPRMAPPTRRTGTRRPVSATTTPSGRILLDFGQNLVGRLRIRVRGPEGATITVRHAEVLTDGELERRPLRGAAATDTFILAGSAEGPAAEPEVFEPRFTFHGFRYADIEGWPGPFDPDAVEAVILGADLRRTGWFSSSHELLNRFHENVVWTARSNLLAVPQDCPQRDERLGWTGDMQLFAPTADFLFDTHAFLRSWLRDLALEQRRLGGVVPVLAPDVVPDFADRGPMAAWGDAIAIIPRVLANSSGDLSLLEEFYPAMRAWVEVLLDHRGPDGLWTTGRQLGDWLDPAAPPNAPARTSTDTDIVATAYLARTTQLVADVARERGDQDDADRYARAAAQTRAAFTNAYVTPAGRMMCDTQTAYALAVAFELVEDPALRQRVADRLAEVVRRDGYHAATGLVGTPIVAPALTAGGHVDAAGRLLLQTEAPSWLFPVTVGATTVWERWDGIRPDGTLNGGHMISFNHVAFGSVADWLHSTVAGLAPAEPGYRRIRIAPTPLRGLDHAAAAHDTPYGRAEAGWRREAGSIRVFAVVPPNTTADVTLPDGSTHEVGSGTHEWAVADREPDVRAPLTLDSSMAELADDPAAYRAFYETLAGVPNPFLREAVRGNALYTAGRSIRDALIFANAATLRAVEEALADAH